jgi:hypothetical protein
MPSSVKEHGAVSVAVFPPFSEKYPYEQNETIESAWLYAHGTVDRYGDHRCIVCSRVAGIVGIAKKCPNQAGDNSD